MFKMFKVVITEDQLKDIAKKLGKEVSVDDLLDYEAGEIVDEFIDKYVN